MLTFLRSPPHALVAVPGRPCRRCCRRCTRSSCSRRSTRRSGTRTRTAQSRAPGASSKRATVHPSSWSTRAPALCVPTAASPSPAARKADVVSPWSVGPTAPRQLRHHRSPGALRRAAQHGLHAVPRPVSPVAVPSQHHPVEGLTHPAPPVSPLRRRSLYCGFLDALEVFTLSLPGAQGERVKTTASKAAKAGQKGIISALATCPDGSGTYVAGSFSGSVVVYDSAHRRVCALKGVEGRGVVQVSSLRPWMRSGRARVADQSSLRHRNRSSTTRCTRTSSTSRPAGRPTSSSASRSSRPAGRSPTSRARPRPPAPMRAGRTSAGGSASTGGAGTLSLGARMDRSASTTSRRTATSGRRRPRGRRWRSARRASSCRLVKVRPAFQLLQLCSLLTTIFSSPRLRRRHLDRHRPPVPAHPRDRLRQQTRTRRLLVLFVRRLDLPR